MPEARPWPDDWEALRRGEGCPVCSEGRPDDIPNGRRFFAGAVADAYLDATTAARGYSLIFWRGRHVADPTELAGHEAAAFALETRLVSLAIERVYRPAKLNFLTLGNSLPHLHTHIVPRYTDDVDPGRPPRFMMVDETWPPMPPAEFQHQVEDLRAAVGGVEKEKRP